MECWLKPSAIPPQVIVDVYGPQVDALIRCLTHEDSGAEYVTQVAEGLEEARWFKCGELIRSARAASGLFRPGTCVGYGSGCHVPGCRFGYEC